MTTDINALRTDAIDAQTRIYDFHDHPYDYDETGNGWRIADRVPALESWASSACYVDTVTLPCGTEIEAPIDQGGEISVTWGADVEGHKTSVAAAWFDADEDDAPGEVRWFAPGDEHYEDVCAALGIEPPPDEDEPDDFDPMMNYLYPIPGRVPEDWPDRVCNTTVVEVDGELFLALTGGGMDMTWEIVASYVGLGYLPPVSFCALPRMGGRGTSKHDKMLISACRRSVEVMRNWLDNKLEELDRMEQWAEEKA